MSGARKRTPGVVFPVLGLALAFGALVCAHEIGTTRVTVAVTDRTYQIDVVTDAASLAEKLAAMNGDQLPATTSATALQARLRAAEHLFRQRVTVRFDDSAVSPETTFTVAEPKDATSPPIATIRLAGAVPSGARGFRWSYGWTFASYALTLRRAGAETPTTEWLEGGEASAVFSLTTAAPPVRRLDVARRYLALGFTHIVPYGLDHMLFVLGIFLLTRRPRAILLQVSAFTIAHSITLGLSIYGVVSVAPRIVEPMIALSIAYVAIENVLLAELKPWRVALVFAFGLLHGLGFAGALRDLGLPRSEFATALLTFNVGVETGQLAVIGAATLVFGWLFQKDWYRRRIVVPASTAIACVAVYWVVERLAG